LNESLYLIVGFYQQVNGLAMGSPVSQTQLFVHSIEERAIESLIYPPIYRASYFDGGFGLSDSEEDADSYIDAHNTHNFLQNHHAQTVAYSVLAARIVSLHDSNVQQKESKSRVFFL